ncbi:DUF2807 domain-containing protein [Pseudoflavitalea sp. G-6-1-2]|uniref:head GIN domain-containing protein n=1 Tax=Pseudoflavitalea sp. G-6-1-2 TaxID=2728841 RepID=UPI00146BA400|nr:head GIN domain-containing protein [Pseudoflavitalea sp. G-6-1-2]NML20998.1 DUF2807 domain-containing protein [Pseudoflavitalea sp. G-6-1-2]
MKKIGLSIAALLFTVVLLGQRTFNDPNAEVREVSNFKGVRVSTGIQLILTQGDTEACAVSVPEEEWRKKVITQVEDGILKIFVEHTGVTIRFKKFRKPIKAYVSIKTVEKLVASAGASMEIDGTVKSDALDLKVASGADFKGNIEVAFLKAESESGADVKISGVASKVDISGGSGSDFHGYDLITEKANVKVNSGASVKLTVNKEISATAGSGGDVLYKGNAVRTSVHTNSGGSVTNTK